MYLIYDTETTGLPRNYEAPVSDLENWPRLVQLAWQLHDKTGELLDAQSYIIRPDNFTIPYNSEKIHGITTERALQVGIELKSVLEKFSRALDQTKIVIGHNIDFDLNIVRAEFLRTNLADLLESKKQLCTEKESLEYCALPGGRGGGLKLPQLGELHHKLFSEDFPEAHNAAADVAATARCFFELIRIGVITAERLELTKEEVEEFVNLHPKIIQPFKIQFESNRQKKEVEEKSAGDQVVVPVGEELLANQFSHLHVHSEYSVLQALPHVKGILETAVKHGMPAVALTDHGNLFGAYDFISSAKEHNIKPILGCEFYIAADRKKLKFTKDNPDRRHFQVLLAKNLTGYQNLSRLSSLGYLEGMYGLYPRIDKGLLEQYTEGLIALSGGLSAEVPDLVLNIGEKQAEEAFCYWHKLFGEDFYVELNRHGLEEEKRVNEVLLRLAKKYNVKIIAANNVYYLEKEDAESHDILLCIQNAEYQSTPIGEGRGQRYGFPNHEFYFKSQDEMRELFKDIPEAISNIIEIIAKVESYDLDRKPIMPDFPLPEGFDDANEYLRHVTYQGAEKRYQTVTPEIRDRIDFELETIRKMGYPGYFLIVQDFLDQARNMGVSVGPGRGSAAGSVVAYCLRITDIDPLKFNLLFERFLNPDRVSLPDIDIDFDEDGRDDVLRWIANKYGENHVAQIITFGKMQPRMAIRDIARVKQLPLHEADRLSKMIPSSPGTTFSQAYKDVPDLQRERKSGDELVRETLRNAELLEGTIRNTGTHACGVIIGKGDLLDYIPLSITKDSELLATQYEGKQIEHVGMLKMDFLGLKTLSIIKDALDNIRHSKGIDIDLENIPFDDKPTYELYSRADTSGIFQFESDGMRKHLRDLKPDRFDDLIAMNALYRPGPMEYIQKYVRRKHGREKIEYDIPVMEDFLKETYGIAIYQEQVMLLSQKLAGFTKGEADSLRKMIGKKQKGILDKLKPKFFEGCRNNGYDEKIITKVWQDWEAFAGYAFNKSHSTCYALLSYRMAYLKTHYPAEFMAAVLSRNLSDIKKITMLIEECQHLGIQVLGPDINESFQNFIVNPKGEIRFGLAAIKGIGESAVKSIIEERDQYGPFASVFDFAKRINLKAVNKRTLEALAYAGAFDSFSGIHRAQYFFKKNDDDPTFLEKIIRYASLYQEKKNDSQHSLFGDESNISIPDPEIPTCEPWSKLQQVKFEKQVTGFYITGHPLDHFKTEIRNFCNVTLEDLNSKLLELKNKMITFAGMIISVEQKTSKAGNPFGVFELEDFSDTLRLTLFSEDYLKMKHLLDAGNYVLVRARVEPNRNNPSRLEIRVNTMILLDDAIEKFTKSLILNFTLTELDNEFLKRLDQSIRANPGKCEIRLKISDPEEKYSIEMHPRKLKVNPASLVKDIEDWPQIEVKME